MNKIIHPKINIAGNIPIPGDKSITHRAVIFGAIAKGITEIRGGLDSADCRATIACFRAMGVDFEIGENILRVEGVGLRGLKSPAGILDVGNSGTTMRLLAGLLAGAGVSAILDGDESIRARPMARIAEPLAAMGADISAIGGLAPITIHPAPQLAGIDYIMPNPSAQVKSAILLAGLNAHGFTRITEIAPGISRNHTEKMLAQFGADIDISDNIITLCPPKNLIRQNLEIPGDISAAAFFIALGILAGDLVLENIGINPTRRGIVDILAKMGGGIEIREKNTPDEGEPIADIRAFAAGRPLCPIDIAPDQTARIIDEIPILALCACFAPGASIIRGAAELRHKESDRIRAICELNKMGAKIAETPDGLEICGIQKLHGATVDSHNDHRIAMMLSIAAALADSPTTILHADCVNTSFPSFFHILDCL